MREVNANDQNQTRKKIPLPITLQLMAEKDLSVQNHIFGNSRGKIERIMKYYVLHGQITGERRG